MRLQGKTAIVTGAASPLGIGAATARRFAEEGAVVILTDLDEGAVVEQAEAIRRDGGQVAGLRHDVTQEASWSDVMARTLEAFGSFDILVNNAGIVVQGGVQDASLPDWERHLAINLTGVFIGCQTAVRQLAKQQSGGSIINISSTAALSAFPGLSGYTATKGGVRALTKSIALDVARLGIRVNSVHPGHIWTDMMARTAKVAPEFIEACRANIPVGEMGQALDIANMNLFLASDEARYVTGAELVVDGGLTAK